MLLALFAAQRMCTSVAMLNFAAWDVGTRIFAIILSNFPLKKTEGYTVSLNEQLNLETCHGPTPINFGGTAQVLLKMAHNVCLQKSRACSALGAFISVLLWK